tara:strand:+ start:1051 stop:1194 length:144 start_codon:yes stop_codon:yes gene_type:complete
MAGQAQSLEVAQVIRSALIQRDDVIDLIGYAQPIVAETLSASVLRLG